jgi:hypothetical protein
MSSVSACEATLSLSSNNLSSVVGIHFNVWSISPGKICHVDPSSNLDYVAFGVL